MKIVFKDVSRGVVDSRAIIQILDGVFLNEITILRKDGILRVEFPQKSFRGKSQTTHWMDILTFLDSNKKAIFEMDILAEHKSWRAKNKEVLVYES